MSREMELGRLLAECPEIALLEGESLADLELKDPSLDSLRHELLNLAASGSSLEKAGVQTHFTRKGMADLLARFAGPAVEDEDPRTLFQRVVTQLRKQAGTRTGRPPDAITAARKSPRPENPRPKDLEVRQRVTKASSKKPAKPTKKPAAKAAASKSVPAKKAPAKLKVAAKPAKHAPKPALKAAAAKMPAAKTPAKHGQARKAADQGPARAEGQGRKAEGQGRGASRQGRSQGRRRRDCHPQAGRQAAAQEAG